MNRECDVFLFQLLKSKLNKSRNYKLLTSYLPIIPSSDHLILHPQICSKLARWLH